MPRYLNRFVALVLMLACAGPALGAVDLSASPTTFSPGAKIKVTAEGLTGSTPYKLRLEADVGGAKYDLATFNSGLSTTKALSPVIPNAAAGTYSIVLYSGSITLTKVADVPAKVVGALGVTLNPTTAPPGKAVVVTVTNLFAGSVRVKYAGETILGPVADDGGTWIGKFVVPKDRPANLPATVAVDVENLVGKTIPKTGSASFNAKAISNAPKLTLSVSQSPATKVDRGSSFPFAGTLKTDENKAPNGDQHLYWKGANGVVLPVDTTMALQDDGSFSVEARAPDWYRDGYLGIDDQPGDLLLVNQGVDLDTDSDSDFRTKGDGPQAIVDGDEGGAATFTLIIKGIEPGPDPPLANVVVEATADYQDAFGYAAPPGGGSNNNDEWVLQSLSQTQFVDTRGSAYQATNVSNYGCDSTAFRRPTNAEGKVTFTISPDDIRRTNFVQVVSQCFTDGLCKQDVEVGPPNGGGDPGPGAKPSGTKAAQVDVGGAIAFNMLVRGGPAGYRSTGITLGYIPDSKTFVNVETGEAFANNTGTILLEKATGEEIDLANWRLEGLGAPLTYTYINQTTSCQVGTCYYTNPYIFGAVTNGFNYATETPSLAMYTFPNALKWPVAPQKRNVGRKMWLTVHPDQTGLLSSGKVTIPGYPPAYFVAQGGVQGCGSGDDQAVQYAAALPDLTEVAPGYVSGTMELTFGTFTAPPKHFVILTQTPPTGIEATNGRIASLDIDALNDTITGSFNVDSPGIGVPSPGHGIGNMDNKSTNSSSFIFVRTADSQVLSQIVSISNNKVAANPGGDKKAEGQNGGYFGFTNPNHNVPQPVVLFDTGLIPLFRYTWGLEPIAGATLGADFWLASELEYYGRLRTQGMNATIDPTVEGGVDIFFDLDILFGLVSASVTAETSIGLTLRTVVGDGGLPGQSTGRCFKFDLDVTWEACAVGICGGDTIDLITVREPSSCSIGAKSYLLAQDKLLPDPGATAAFDLARPRPVASAVATDGRGASISLGVTDAGALVATHLSGAIVEFTRTIAAAPVGVQHVDVAFYGANKAMAVWSENTRTEAQIANLVKTLKGAAFADIVKTQRLRYSFWNGKAWSAPANLTGTGNDGKPRLGGCLASPRFVANACPVGGEITAVWERDANANLNAPDLEVWSATWTPGTNTWSSPARVSATGTSSDMLPQVAYRNAVPVVAWVSNPEGQFSALVKRRPVFRFLDGSSPQHIATALGASVGWLSLGVDPDDRLLIAYTQGQDSQGFVGNRQALRVARGTCSAGDCTFEVTEPRDPNGRQFRVERPSVMFDQDGTPLIGFRAVGFGPDGQNRFGLPGDPPGTLLGTGELATVRITSFATPNFTAEFRPLTSDGLQHWKPAMVFDDTVDGILAVSRDAAAPIQQTAAMKFVKAFSPKGLQGAAAATALDDGASLRTLDGGPDFTLRDPVLSKRVVSAGQTLTLNLKLVNQGQAYDPAVHGPLKVLASWNAPAGAGTVGGTYDLTQTQAANAQRALAITVTVPAGVSSDERQTLFIDIVAADDANASGGRADQLREVLNAMPVPFDLIVSTRLDSNFVNVTWDSAPDTRVYGWRIWRLGLDGTWKHVGATTKPGYMDLFAPVGQEVQYRVASYSDNGMESEPSEPVSGFVRASKADAMFANGFENP